MVRHEGEARGSIGLPGGAGDELDASLDAGLKSPIARIEELLLVVIGFGQDIDGLLRTVGLQNVSTKM